MTIEIADFTQAKVDGTGIFDVLMQAAKGHLEQEFSKSRIKGPEYSQVYLGTMTQVLQTALQYTLNAELTSEKINTEKLQQQLLTQQISNAEVEGRVLESTVCKLKAEFDLLQEQKLKTVAETALLNQKMATEKAQTIEAGVDDNSVVGKQKLLYAAQTNGFTRDAEQKAAKLMVDSWSVRRTTDEGTVADSTNMLDDATVGRTVARLLAGVNA